MGEEKPKQQTTSILELLYLIRAKNKGELSFVEWRTYASEWAKAVIADYERRQPDIGAINEDKRCQWCLTHRDRWKPRNT